MRILITGGCGFIGCNTAAKLASLGHEVTVLDNLSREGSIANLSWLRTNYLALFVKGDIRDRDFISNLIAKGRFDAIIHLAAQVAVTTSVADPRMDCDVNILGTLNILEGIRLGSPNTILLNASTNKVYGKLAKFPIEETKLGYSCPAVPEGVAETQPLEFYSPYGCSKGAADQYVMDYSRVYGLRTATFRQSCIYGGRQFGVEDQGWVAWFIIAHVMRRPITIYGDGKQVRDILFVDDLVDLYQKALGQIDKISGSAFNVGGGRNNAISLLEFLNVLGQISGTPVEFGYGGWRPGDQLYYVSDIRKAGSELSWKPSVGAREGIARLYEWVCRNKELFAQPLGLDEEAQSRFDLAIGDTAVPAELAG